jgi:hypothetical protein
MLVGLVQKKLVIDDAKPDMTVEHSEPLPTLCSRHSDHELPSSPPSTTGRAATSEHNVHSSSSCSSIMLALRRGSLQTNRQTPCIPTIRKEKSQSKEGEHVARREMIHML